MKDVAELMLESTARVWSAMTDEKHIVPTLVIKCCPRNVMDDVAPYSVEAGGDSKN